MITKLLTYLTDLLCLLAARLVFAWWSREQRKPLPHPRNGVETPCDAGWIDDLETRLMG